MILETCHSLRGSVDWNQIRLLHQFDTIWSLPTRECGLKLLLFSSSLVCQGHSLRGSVDWNRSCQRVQLHGVCHSLRGSVDWNYWIYLWSRLDPVTPYAGVWIEISWNYHRIDSIWSLPTRECGLKLLNLFLHRGFEGHSLRGSVDWNRSLEMIRSQL